MGKILVYLYQDMADFEMTLPSTSVGWIQKEMITIADKEEVIKAHSNVQYMPHTTVKKALLLEDVEGLIIPGGWNDRCSDDLKELIKKLNSENKLLAAICAGPQFLAKSGVLYDKKYTTTLTKEVLEKDNKKDFFPRENYLKQNVVRDQNIVTAVGNAFVDFTMEILDYFNAFKDEDQKTMYQNHYKGL